MRFLVHNLDGGIASILPQECKDCGWWQGYDDGWPGPDAARSWIEAAGEELGFWGKVATGDEQLIGFIQFGPTELFSRARDIAGKEVRDSFLLACGVIAGQGVDSIRKSLLMAALAELKELEVEQLDAFCSNRKEESDDCRLFSRQFLGDCGFYPVKDLGELTMMRLELGGTQPSRTPRERAARLLERLKHPSAAPSPAAMCKR